MDEMYQLKTILKNKKMIEIKLEEAMLAVKRFKPRA